MSEMVRANLSREGDSGGLARFKIRYKFRIDDVDKC